MGTHPVFLREPGAPERALAVNAGTAHAARHNRFPHQAGSIGSPSTMVEGEPSGPTGTSPMSVTR